MTRLLRVLLAVAVPVALASCAGRVSETTCHTQDWRGLGYRDALKGQLSRVQDIQQACTGFAVDAGEYRLGFDEGLDEFCSADRAFEHGRRSGDYEGQCPGALHGLFLRAYQAGLAVRRLERELAAIEARIRDLELSLDSGGLNRDQYYSYRDELRELYQQHRSVETQLARLRRY